ncbi:MAG: toxic anion resistance protein [Oscillospiraceae bacterium]|nr:toxic anion resistance protein [Oscillospiraceae bacterium]
MGLQFTPSSESAAAENAVTTEQAVSAPNIQVSAPENFSMVEVQETIKNDLVKNEAVQKLVDSINVNDLNSIVKFGNDAATEISKASDQVLNTMNMDQINDSGEMLTALAAVMDQFDMKELTEEPKKGLFANLRKQIDKLLDKYHTMGENVDRIYVQLKTYEKEIEQSNVKLEQMYNANINYYKDLTLYIMAGEQACVELDQYIADYRQKLADNPDSGAVAMDLQNLENVREVFEQRVMDLKIAENVAMQTVPMLKTMQFSNLNLIRKINSAFIITMPVFKQSLAQAVMLKRQKIQADAMSALDEKTNELLVKNAHNTVEQSKAIARMASGSSIKVETLEETWNTIVTGIEETRKIQEEAKVKRAEDSRKLQALKEDYRLKLQETKNY